MARPPEDAIRCLKPSGARSVWLVRRAGAPPRVLKAWPLTPKTILTLLVGRSQAQRQRRGSRLTARAGVATPAVTAGPRLSRRGLRPVVEIEHDYVDGREAYDCVRDGTMPRESLGRACGRIVARYAGAGVYHRDLKLSNLIVAERDEIVWVIDTVGVRRMRRPDVEIARMLERLWVQVGEEGVPAAGALRPVVLRAALRPLRPALRRAVMRRLR